MTQWYASTNGQQYGPAEEEQLKTWIAEGRVKAGDLFWSEGMPNWVQGYTLPYLFPQAQSASGTGGTTPNAALMAQARATLSGNWGLSIAFLLLISLMLNALAVMPIVGIATLVVIGAFQLSIAAFFLTISRGGKGDLGQMFWGFKHLGTALGTFLLMMLFIYLWMLLLIIPGIIAAYAYSMTFFILADDPNIGCMEALRKSKQMMQGKKGKLFCLVCRFIGWYLLCCLTLGIGLLWLSPYMHVSFAKFYDDLKAAPAAPAVAVVESTPQPPIA